MTRIWCLLISFLFLMTIFGIRYEKIENMLGQEAARRYLRYVFPSVLLVFVGFLWTSSLGKYGLVSVYILFDVLCIIWLLRWLFRKSETGDLLLDIEITPKSKLLFWVGLLEIALAGFLTWLSYVQVSIGLLLYDSLVIEVPKLVFCWLAGILFMLQGLSKPEFRENGICFRCLFIAWQKVKSYKWQQSKSSMLTIKFKPRYSLFHEGFMSIVIPAKHQEAVSHLLNERIQSKTCSRAKASSA